MSTDSIVVRGLRVPCHIGVTEEERAQSQEVLVDISAELDLSRAAETDDLGATLDYGTLTGSVAALVRDSDSKLLEHLAGKIAAEVLSDPAVTAVTVEIGKAHPPVEAEVGSIGVRLRKERR